jgi:hypothetical protein
LNDRPWRSGQRPLESTQILDQIERAIFDLLVDACDVLPLDAQHHEDDPAEKTQENEQRRHARNRIETCDLRGDRERPHQERQS